MNFIKQTIKQLQREYGFPTVLYNITEVIDLDTGKKRQTIQIKNIARAILLPVNQYCKSTYCLDDSELLVNYCDFEIKVGTKVIYDEQHYDVIEVNIYEEDVAYILKMRAIEGTEFIALCSATDTLILSDEACI